MLLLYRLYQYYGSLKFSSLFYVNVATDICLYVGHVCLCKIEMSLRYLALFFSILFSEAEF